MPGVAESISTHRKGAVLRHIMHNEQQVLFFYGLKRLEASPELFFCLGIFFMTVATFLKMKADNNDFHNKVMEMFV